MPAEIPADVAERFTSADKLSDPDRQSILDIATRALASFQPKPAPKPEAKGDEAKAGPKTKAKSELETEAKTDTATPARPAS